MLEPVRSVVGAFLQFNHVQRFCLRFDLPPETLRLATHFATFRGKWRYWPQHPVTLPHACFSSKSRASRPQNQRRVARHTDGFPMSRTTRARYARSMRCLKMARRLLRSPHGMCKPCGQTCGLKRSFMLPISWNDKPAACAATVSSTTKLKSVHFFLSRAP